MDILSSITRTAGSGMRAQSERLQVVAENMANADTTASTPGADPYRRKVVVFDDVLDRASGADLVTIRSVTQDPSPFRMNYDPSHPAADGQGYVKLPNVNPMIELANMREAARSYEANLNMLETGRQMRTQIIDVLG